MPEVRLHNFMNLFPPLIRDTFLSRYFTVLRLSLPRSTNEEFIYEGKKIPVGTTIFLNAWACNMGNGAFSFFFCIVVGDSLNRDTDSDLWDDPDTFRPERWLEYPNNPLFTFGIGYRMCAGSLLAYRELYLTFLRMISAFEVRTDAYIETHPLRGVADLTTLVSMPKLHKVRFIPRSEDRLRKEICEISGKGSR